MGSVESILSLKAIVEKEAQKQPIIVVVSALGGITDKLIATSVLAQKGDETWKDEFQAMVERHHKMIDTIITDPRKREQLFNIVDSLFEQLRSIYFGVYLIHDLSKKTQDAHREPTASVSALTSWLHWCRAQSGTTRASSSRPCARIIRTLSTPN